MIGKICHSLKVVRGVIHVRYQSDEASISIEDGSVLDGVLPSKQLKMVQAWIEILGGRLGTCRKWRRTISYCPTTVRRYEMLIDVVSVKPLHNFQLDLEYKNGERRRFDMRPLLEIKPWNRIAALPLFERVRVDYGTVVWPGEIDIAPETLYDLSVPL